MGQIEFGKSWEGYIAMGGPFPRVRPKDSEASYLLSVDQVYMGVAGAIAV